MKHYDLNGTKIIESMETPWIYCNDNMTVDEKQAAYDDSYEWFFETCQILESNRKSMYPNHNVIHIEEFLR